MENTGKNFFQRNMGWIIPVGIIVLLGLWGMSQYNGFITENEAITSQWAQVENQLQRRFDLIPNLIATVKGASAEELSAIKLVTDARTRYAGATTPDQKAAAAGQVESALGRLLVINENYPQLQAQQSYRDLTVSLEGTENRIAVERMKYNNQVQVFNTDIKRFPGSIFAKIFGLAEHAYFNAPEAAQTVPKVDFSNQ